MPGCNLSPASAGALPKTSFPKGDFGKGGAFGNSTRMNGGNNAHLSGRRRSPLPGSPWPV